MTDEEVKDEAAPEEVVAEKTTEDAPVEEAPAAETPAEEAAPEEESTSIADDLTLGEGAPADGEEEEKPYVEPTIRGRIDKHGVAMGTGRRKTSVARVRIKSGDGKFTVNGREMNEFFPLIQNQQMVQAPLVTTEQLGKVDVWVRVNGGGTTGQTGAVVLGIARALQAMDVSNHPKLSEGGFLTRDGRMVERKKYGFKKARKSFQFSKR